MNTRAILALVVSLSFAGTVYADSASGMASGKRQHKPLSAEQPADETEQQGTRVRKPMQDLKNNAADPVPAMNKADLTETLASPAAAGDDKTRGKKRDARKAAQERAEEIAAGKAKDDDVASKTNKNEAARARKKH